VALVLLVLAGGQAYYQAETRFIHEKQSRELEAIASLQADQIVKWLTERRADVTRSAESPLLQITLAEWLRSSEATEHEAHLRARLRLDRDAYEYAEVALLDPEGNVLLAVGEDPISVGPATRAALAAAMSAEDPVFSEFFEDAKGGICIDVVSPVTDETGRLLALMLLRSSAEQYLYPLIRSWPVPTASAEILLVRRHGEHVLVLNPLRFRPDAALRLKFPIERSDFAAVRAALGDEGVIEAGDYRGVRVLAAMRSIPGTDWAMVAKVDAGEILAEARYRSGVVVFFVFLAIAAAALGMVMAYRQRQAELFRELYLSERDQRGIHEQFRTVLYSIGDAVITTDTDGLIRHVNAVAERLTGWTESEALGHPLDEVFRIVNEDTRAVHENPVHRVLREGEIVGLANHTVLIARDGTERPIADSAAPVRDSSGDLTGVVLVFRDQTEERAAARALRQREERYRLLFDANPHPMWVYDLETLAFLEVNDAAVAHYGFTREEFLAMTIADIRPPEDVPRLRESVEAAARRGPSGGADRAGIWRHRRKDGSIIDVAITSHVLDYDGRRC
jgi:PAS domain S-box-containing protein